MCQGAGGGGGGRGNGGPSTRPQMEEMVAQQGGGNGHDWCSRRLTLCQLDKDLCPHSMEPIHIQTLEKMAILEQHHSIMHGPSEYIRGNNGSRGGFNGFT